MSDKENRLSTIGIGFATLLALALIIAVLVIRPIAPTTPTPTNLPTDIFTIAPTGTTPSTPPVTSTPVPTIPTFTLTPEPSTTFTNIPTDTSVPSVTPTLYSGPSISVQFTLSPFPSPVKNAVGTNLPFRFKVETWHDDYECNSNRYTVRIDGVEIANGVSRTSQYKFIFWQDEDTYEVYEKSVTLIKTDREYITLDEPVTLTKGKYAHVVIAFQVNDDEVTWIDDLYYPFSEFNPQCK